MIANGAAVQPGYEEVGTQGFGNTYEEPQAIVTVEAGNRLSNGLTPNGMSQTSLLFFSVENKLYVDIGNQRYTIVCA